MRLGMFMMPLHPAHREPSQTSHEDREAVILADGLGFHDVFVGEHLTEKSENVTNSFIFLATLISDTKTIKLATGTSNLFHSHPTLIAAHAAMFDHLAKGIRFRRTFCSSNGCPAIGPIMSKGKKGGEDSGPCTLARRTHHFRGRR